MRVARSRGATDAPPHPRRLLPATAGARDGGVPALAPLRRHDTGVQFAVSSSQLAGERRCFNGVELFAYHSAIAQLCVVVQPRPVSPRRPPFGRFLWPPGTSSTSSTASTSSRTS